MYLWWGKRGQICFKAAQNSVLKMPNCGFCTKLDQLPWSLLQIKHKICLFVCDADFKLNSLLKTLHILAITELTTMIKNQACAYNTHWKKNRIIAV